MEYDVIIIGGGVTGNAIAFELSKYKLNIALLESENDIAQKTTKANSGIVHAGYDPLPGTNMARLNVLGCAMYKDLSKQLNIHYKNIGSFVIARNDKEKQIVDTLYDRGIKNGVPDLKILNHDEIMKMEPNLSPDIQYALYAPSCGIVSPWEVALAFGENAARNGVEYKLNHKVTDISQVKDGFEVVTNKGKFNSKYVINAAGTRSDEIYSMVLKHEAPFKITPVKGEYFLLDKDQGKLVNHVIFQTPNELGKGVLVSQTVHGNLIVGPNASNDVESKDDVSTTQAALDYIKKAAAITCPNINYRDNIRNFSGIRAHVNDLNDFIIGEDEKIKGFINFAGIKSPGLTCAPAFGLEAADILKKSGLNLVKKENHIIKPLPKYFKDMTKEEINELVKKNPLYGRIICRCETVSEGEIVDALHRPIVVNSIDGVKRRTNAGMGRCQGGFCGPKVLEIIKRELHIRADDVLQDKEGSNIVLSHTKGGSENE